MVRIQGWLLAGPTNVPGDSQTADGGRFSHSELQSLTIFHRCPTYQLRPPPKTRFGEPKSHLQGNARELGEMQGYVLRNTVLPRKKGLIQGTPGNAFLGIGRNTVSRVLFRRRELTEFCGKLGEFRVKLGEFVLAHK